MRNQGLSGTDGRPLSHTSSSALREASASEPKRVFAEQVHCRGDLMHEPSGLPGPGWPPLRSSATTTSRRAGGALAGGRVDDGQGRPCLGTSRASRADQGRKAGPRPVRPRRHTATATAPGTVAPAPQARRNRAGPLDRAASSPLSRWYHVESTRAGPEGVAAGFDRKEPVAAGSPSPHRGHGHGSRGICSVTVVRGAA